MERPQFLYGPLVVRDLEAKARALAGWKGSTNLARVGEDGRAVVLVANTGVYPSATTTMTRQPAEL